MKIYYNYKSSMFNTLNVDNYKIRRESLTSDFTDIERRMRLKQHFDEITLYNFKLH